MRPAPEPGHQRLALSAPKLTTPVRTIAAQPGFAANRPLVVARLTVLCPFPTVLPVRHSIATAVGGMDGGAAARALISSSYSIKPV
ncbi:hypothetical protein B0I33_11027 [Prauserella shujinwangii]|uniref:Uncharacterized protein n=1 Tax=Prauserella shujinwangii TaxID=1453103 RepID=A0A2T0LNV9_9PSEU|nr:hypothetical protein B0I33_11027 [Prauserella shujinwangii]